MVIILVRSELFFPTSDIFFFTSGFFFNCKFYAFYRPSMLKCPPSISNSENHYIQFKSQFRIPNLKFRISNLSINWIYENAVSEIEAFNSKISYNGWCLNVTLDAEKIVTLRRISKLSNVFGSQFSKNSQKS